MKSLNIKYIFIPFLFIATPLWPHVNFIANGEFKKEKKSLISSIESSIEQLQERLLNLEVRILQHNQDLTSGKENIIDRNHLKLQQIEKDLKEELEVVKKIRRKNKHKLEESKQSLEYLNEEIRTLLKNIEQKLSEKILKS